MSVAQREPDEYVGCATDETWRLFDEVSALVDDADADAPLVLSPADGAHVAASPLDITWQDTPTIVGQTAGDVAATCPQWSQGWSTLHLPPISGAVFDLQVVKEGVVVHRVLTTLQEWTASADTGKKLAGSTVQLVLHRIVVVDNARQAGPFATTTPWSLTMGE